jgi:hypothetical protein
LGDTVNSNDNKLPRNHLNKNDFFVAVKIADKILSDHGNFRLTPPPECQLPSIFDLIRAPQSQTMNHLSKTPPAAR